MKNKKGQALVEFIILLPVIVYVFMGFVDLILIASYKSNIDSKMDDVITLYKDNREYEINDYLNKDLENVTYKVAFDEKYTYIEVNMDYNFITPGLNNILKDFNIKSERVIVNA